MALKACSCGSGLPLDKRELALTIADHGNWEEFHQKRGNWTMYDFHKDQRLRLEQEYRKRFAQKTT